MVVSLATKAADALQRATPWDQRATRLAMRAYAAQGDYEAVSRALAAVERALDDDEEPDAETMAVVHELLAEGRRRAQRQERGL